MQKPGLCDIGFIDAQSIRQSAERTALRLAEVDILGSTGQVLCHFHPACLIVVVGLFLGDARRQQKHICRSGVHIRKPRFDALRPDDAGGSIPPDGLKRLPVLMRSRQCCYQEQQNCQPENYQPSLKTARCRPERRAYRRDGTHWILQRQGQISHAF